MALASGIFALIAAVFWFISAATPPPPMVTYWGSAPPSDPFFASIVFGGNMNRWAAFFSGLSALCGFGSALAQHRS
jgi:hypothetical protein